MSDLILRAEQGVLGALLTGADTALISANLYGDDFGHPTHRAVYQALLDVELVAFDTTEQRAEAVAAVADRPDVDAAWLVQLADVAPAAELVSEYTRIVLQASFDRDVAGFAQPYYDAAALTADEAGRDVLTRLGQALDAQAAAFSTAATVDVTADARVSVDLVLARTDVRVELHREDLIIADIVQHPEQAVEVAAWLDPAVFTTGQRRLTFELAVSLAYDGDLFDTVTLAWHVQRARDFASYDASVTALPSGDGVEFGAGLYLAEPPAEPDFVYLTRLHAVTVTTGTAVVIGRELLTEHVHTTLALSATAVAERATTSDAASHTTAPPARRITASPPPVTSETAAPIRPIEL
ncbi:DnaB-like helicase N-terminal domain-containing protein [Dactylosporangium sp. NPDC000521]|uniref:DnaB-like helicase N-terminal domain-containing protein n=1 Tax=Dactylosporangium sp. NPDC000521 TaxID=3363975 RepID=UPI0036AB1009